MNCNSTRDEDSARILDALADNCNSLKEISFCNNEMGFYSITALQKILNKTYPNHLIDLRLSKLRLSTTLLNMLLNSLAINSSLTKLKLSQLNLGTCRNFKPFLDLIKNDCITSLDLSWS